MYCEGKFVNLKIVTMGNISTKDLRPKEFELFDLQQKAIKKLPSREALLKRFEGFEYEKSLIRALFDGLPKFDRTGTDTIGIHGHQSRFNLDEGFPLITTKKVHLKSIIHELLWLVRGETNIKYLVENGVSIWSDWPLEHCNQERKKNAQFHASMSGTTALEYEADFIEDFSIDEFHQKILHEPGFAEKWGELGPVYGKQWRSWPGFKLKTDMRQFDDSPEAAILKIGVFHPYKNEVYSDFYEKYTIDQIQQVVDMINKQHMTGVISRRMLVTAWNPADLEEMAKAGLPPCHCLFQFHSRLMTLEERKRYWAKVNKKHYSFIEKMDDDMLDAVNAPVYELDLQLFQRSCDSFLGVAFNIASYALLLMMTAQATNCKPGTFIHDYGDFHIYKNHLDQIVEQLSRDPRQYPVMRLKNRGQKIDEFEFDDFVLENYYPHPAIKAPVAV